MSSGPTSEIEANLSPLSRRANQRRQKRDEKKTKKTKKKKEGRRRREEEKVASHEPESGNPENPEDSLGTTGEMPTFDALLPLDSDPRAERLYQIAKKWASGHKVTTASIITFVMVLIASLQEIVTEPSHGKYKKRVLLTVLRKVIDEEEFENEEDKMLISVMVDSTVPMVIDAAVGIATGQIDLHKLFATCSPCCAGGKVVVTRASGTVPR